MQLQMEKFYMAGCSFRRQPKGLGSTIESIGGDYEHSVGNCIDVAVCALRGLYSNSFGRTFLRVYIVMKKYITNSCVL